MRLGLPHEGRALDTVVVALAAVGQIEIWAGPAPEPKLAAAAGALLATVPLLLRRRFPFAAPVFVFAAVAALSVARPEAVRGGASGTLLAFLLAFWIVGARNERNQAVAGAAVGFAAIAVLADRAAAPQLRAHPPFPGGAVRFGGFDVDVVFFVVLAAGLSLAACAFRARARRASALEAQTVRLERERDEQARAAVASERRRIARDLHDVIVHGVSVMTVQAGAARVLIDEEPRRAREPLLAVEEAGRQTLAETRRLLGILRADDDVAALTPGPGLAALATLPVELAIEGEPRPLPPGVELAAYRVVQEALTHAHDARAGVVVRYGAAVLELEVRGVARNGDSLLGVRERVTFYGGELETDSKALRARFPVELNEPTLARREFVTRPQSHGGHDERGVWTLLRRHAFDTLVVALAVVSEIEIWVTSVPGPTAVLVPAVLLWTLPLLWRRRFPLAAPACVFAVLTASTFAGDAVGGDITSAIPFFLAFWAVGAHNERKHALAGVALGIASTVVIVDRDVRLQAADTVSAIVTAGALALAAFVLQRRARQAGALEERAARLEQEREERAHAAVTAERRRIARDLHDVIAHSVSVMTVQAGAARLLLAEEPQRALEPLLSVEQTGRQSLAEMRGLLGFLDTNESEAGPAPRPGLAALTGLVADVRTAGLPVELSVEGAPRALAPGVELAAYRIVQEALTNARKHAAPTRADVALRYGRNALELEITNDGRRQTRAEGMGHGLVGMRERVALYGGELEAGPREGGGYVVRARLPVEAMQL